MKKLLLSLFILVTSLNSFAQDWRWMKGSNAVNQLGKYGTMGVSSPTNYPGARHFSATWTDASGNLWLFGGEGYSAAGPTGYLNDLWKYNISTGVWTWMKGTNTTNQLGKYGSQGVTTSTNCPGSRSDAYFSQDKSGNLYLFGGYGYGGTASGHLSDVWKYNIATNNWTWVKGTSACNAFGYYSSPGAILPANTPGGRQLGMSWSDTLGNLWIFGGEGYASAAYGYLWDIWEYIPSSNNWMWGHGGNAVNVNGAYGTLGVAGPLTNPGSRYFPAAGWRDLNGDLWLYGGDGFPVTGSMGMLGDIWKFTISTKLWTWKGGSNTVNQGAVYGPQGVPSTTNIPSGKKSSSYWSDPYGYFWLLAGVGVDTIGNTFYTGELWKFNPTTNEWAWMKGSAALGIYGTMGISAPVNRPGSRAGAVSWTDLSGNLWLFGGDGYGATAPYGYLNDLWKFDNCLQALPSGISGPNNLCIGAGATNYSVAVAAGVGAVSYTWSLPAGWTGSSTTNTIIITPASSGVFSIAATNTCGTTSSQTLSVTINSLPTVSTTTSDSLLCIGQTATLTGNGAATYTWNPGGTGTSISVSPTVTTNYTVTGKDANGCLNSFVFTQPVSICTDFYKLNKQNLEVKIFPNPNNGEFTISLNVVSENLKFEIYDVFGKLISEGKINSFKNKVDLSKIPNGIYLLRITDFKAVIKQEKIIKD